MCRSIDFEERPAVAYTIEIIPKFIADELQDFVIDLWSSHPINWNKHTKKDVPTPSMIVTHVNSRERRLLM